VTSFQEKAAEKGKIIDARAIFGLPEFRKTIETIVTEKLQKSAPPRMQEETLKDLLGGELSVRGRGEIQVRKSVEAFLARSYLRARVSRAVDRYLKQL
jgi:hypothetical protein